jgi:hypothetical protein
VKALLHLQRPVEARTFLQQSTNDPLYGEQEHRLAVIVDRAIREQQYGEYDVEAMREYFKLTRREQSKNPQYFCDFESPCIEVIETEEKGRCVKATAQHEPGTLLMASNAFSVYRRPEEDFDSLYGRYCEEDHTQLRFEIIQSVLQHPERTCDLYSLTDSSGDLKPPPRIGAIDLLRIQRIIRNNSFEVIDDVGSHMHCFSEVESNRQLLKFGKFKNNSKKTGIGLWIRPSLFNHSCDPNCCWLTIGDFMFIVTTRHVKPNEELCISYLDPQRSFADRESALKNWNDGQGFKCDCPRCVISSSSSSSSSLTTTTTTTTTSAAAWDDEILFLEKGTEELLKAASSLHEGPLDTHGGHARAAKLVLNTQQGKFLLEKIETIPFEVKLIRPLATLLELQYTALVGDGKFAEALAICERASEVYASISWYVEPKEKIICDIRLAFVCILGGNQQEGFDHLSKAFHGACFPKWTKRISVYDFECLILKYQVGDCVQAVTSVVEMMNKLNRETGFKAQQEQSLYCAYCLGDCARNKLKKCSRCGEAYCCEKHQNLHRFTHSSMCTAFGATGVGYAIEER